MNYDIYANNEIIASGLSVGELSQWIIDLDKELKNDEKYRFRKDLGFQVHNENFEEVVYENLRNTIQSKLQVNLTHGKDLLKIVENDF